MQVAKGVAYYKHFRHPLYHPGTNEIEHQRDQTATKLWIFENVFTRNGDFVVDYKCALAMKAGIIYIIIIFYGYYNVSIYTYFIKQAVLQHLLSIPKS